MTTQTNNYLYEQKIKHNKQIIIIYNERNIKHHEYLFVLLKYLFSVAEINYLVLKISFEKNMQIYASVILFWRSWHKKDNGAFRIKFGCTVYGLQFFSMKFSCMLVISSILSPHACMWKSAGTIERKHC